MNAEQLDLLEVQNRMQRKSIETTKLHIIMAKRLAKLVSNIFVPPSLRTAETA